ncbi:Major Facilitator Superfamily protein [Neomoorella glycerini]|uniref:Major Facilitator Superfamily protein n=1 Tax=Neomoorella glycerini TaxID=55779 RepID=A0A6I5ZU65_9FIRM|nr:MFS transporter [Moorella glycerini]QGP93165.1 Major Facilitator Superfamily protein [Moorella glycerini]
MVAKSLGNRFFYGWVCVGAAFLVLFAYQVHYTFGVYLEPLVNEFGWSRASTSAAYSLACGVSIPLGILWGKILDVYGPRIVFALSCFLGGLGLFLSGFISQLWQFYLTFGLLWGAGWSAFFLIPNSVVRRWFIKKAGLALGIAVCGIPLGWVVLFPLTAYLVDAVSIKGAFMSMGILIWLIGLVTAIVVKQSPEDIGLGPDGEVLEPLAEERVPSSPGFQEWEAGEAVRSRSFWMLWLVMFGLITVLSVVTVHGLAHCVQRGILREVAARIFGLMGLISILGRLGFGSLGDYLARKGMPPIHARRYMYTISGLLMGLGIIILSKVSGLGGLWAWAFVFGVGYGAHVPQTASITGDMFGRKNLGFIMTLLGTAPGLAGIAGPIFAGWIYDLTGSYGVALQVAVLICLLVMVFSLLIVPPRRLAREADEDYCRVES